MHSFELYSFYRFTKISNKIEVKKKLDQYLENKIVRGTILLADEGINASISGNKEDLIKIFKFIKKILNIRKINLKINNVDYLPFNRIKVRLKKEIVSLGLKLTIENDKINNYIHPSKWDEFISKKDIKVLDIRNIYEIEIGKFKKSINPFTETFREFPNKLKKLNISKTDQIAIYCTGGIRCEKASHLLREKGFKKIFQLQGGILNYFAHKKNYKTKSLWSGDCFVFDERVSVNKYLESGNYIQCYGCRRPLNKDDLKSNKYVKGVSCQKCFYERSANQKKNSINRQTQIEKAEEQNLNHPFKKIKLIR